MGNELSTSSEDGKEIVKKDETELKTTILVVDDNKEVRQNIRKVLELQDDFKIVGVAVNGKEAVRFVQENAPQVVLMDVNMPVMNGIEATRKIATIMPGIAIIGLSLHSSPQVIDKMKNAGASAYITKSDIIPRLSSTIRNEAALIPN